MSLILICRYILKYAVCSHISICTKSLARKGRKHSIKATDFNYNIKRGATKKLSRYKLSEPALSQY